MGLVSEVTYLQINKSLIGGNAVSVTRIGNLRIVNGYVNITEPFNDGDILVYLPEGDRPVRRQWYTGACFSHAGSVGKTLGMYIDNNGADIHVNDNATSLKPGAYNISFIYFV